MLQDVFDAQRALNEKTIGFDPCKIEDEETRLKWFRNYLTAWDQELKELLGTVDPSVVIKLAEVRAPDQNNLKIEVVDMLHFLISMIQVLGYNKIQPPSFRSPIPRDLKALFVREQVDNQIPNAEHLDPMMISRLVAYHGLKTVVMTGYVLDHVQWKWWAKQSNQWEIVYGCIYGDLFPLWVCLALSVGMDAEDVRELYMKKNKLNFARQEGGYKDGTYEKVDEAGSEDNEKLFEQES